MTRREGHVVEDRAAFVMVERVRVVRKVGHIQVRTAIIVVVADGQSHPCLLPAIFVERETRDEAGVFEDAITQVAIEKSWC